MKTKSTNRRKDTANSTIYKTELYTACHQDLLAIVKAHYVYSTYINHFGNLFTTKDLRPELQIDYSGLLAKCFGYPHEAPEVKNILKRNYPTGGWNLAFNCELAINQIHDFFLNKKGWDSNIIFDHEVVRELIISICAITAVKDGMEVMLFRDSERSFEQVGSLQSSFHIDPIYDIILRVLGGSTDNDKHTTGMIAVYTADIFNSPNVQKKADEDIAYLLRVIETFKEERLIA